MTEHEATIDPLTQPPSGNSIEMSATETDGEVTFYDPDELANDNIGCWLTVDADRVGDRRDYR